MRGRQRWPFVGKPGYWHIESACFVYNDLFYYFLFWTSPVIPCNNGRPHADPWIRCPNVGPYENFMEVRVV